ncbi:hypothetical protein PG997_014032 [Apiospora hydei]|uniref:Uncharacterized protein n=1 Tax=Apiospora hydei TaxID=1337664 RepID=A0ABR1V7W4_9PEZI
MDVSCISRTFYKTKDMDKAACRQGVKGCLHNGFGPHELLGTSHPLNAPGDVDDYTNRLNECLTVPFYAMVEKIEISPTRSVRFVTNNVKRPLKLDQSDKLVYEPPEIVDCLLSSQFGKENISKAPPAANASTGEQDPADISTDDEVPIVDPYQIKFILAKLRAGAAILFWLRAPG